MKKELELKFEKLLKKAKLKYKQQVKLIEGRRFSWDFVIYKSRKPILGVEIQGGIWMRRGAHNTGKAINRDSEKSCLGLSLGIPTLPVTDANMDLAIEAVKAFYKTR